MRCCHLVYNIVQLYVCISAYSLLTVNWLGVFMENNPNKEFGVCWPELTNDVETIV